MNVKLLRKGVNMYKKILIPTDGSTYVDQVIDRVTNLIPADGQIIILSVAPQLHSNTFQRKGRIQELNEELLEEAIENVENHEKKFPEGYNIKTIAKTGYPADTINNVAQEENVDLIVISASGKSGFRKFVIGSVAEKVLKISKVDVLLVHKN